MNEEGENVALGAKIRELRKRLDLTQVGLAELAGLSQSNISRLEAGQTLNPAFKDLASISRALDITPRELLEGTEAAELLKVRQSEEEESFIAYCPNPFCESNRADVDNDGKPFVKWSFCRYRLEDFDRINFCPFCGEKLLKSCPGCGQPIETSGNRYCIRCGSVLSQRPTAEEWDRIRKERTGENGHIPF
jgi:transcriptional regulator with XRE-family HTH domain